MHNSDINNNIDLIFHQKILGDGSIEQHQCYQTRDLGARLGYF